MNRSASPLRFQSPLGVRVRWTTVLCVALCPVLTLLGFWLQRLGSIPAEARWPVQFAPLIAFVVLIPLILLAWIRGLRLESDVLVVERLARTTRIPLAGLTAVAHDREALRGAFKLFGNDGAGAITGWFTSKHLGRFRAYVTDRENAVVLRWPGRTVVVSPERPGAFVSAVRRQVGLGR